MPCGDKVSPFRAQAFLFAHMKNVATQHTLDREAEQQVGWYAEQFGRDQRDVVNGIVAGAIKRMRENFDETARECADASASLIDEDVAAATRRRVG